MRFDRKITLVVLILLILNGIVTVSSIGSADNENNNQYSLTINISPEHMKNEVRVTPELGTHYYNESEQLTVEFQFVVVDDKWYFDGWTGDVPDEQKDKRELKLTMDQDREITLNFDALEVKINSTSGGRVITPGEGTFEFGPMHSIDLEAIPYEGYKFDKWTGDTDLLTDPHDPYANKTHFYMGKQINLTANFVKLYELKIVQEGNGTVKVNGTEVEQCWGETFEKGTMVHLEAVPEDGYKFVGWSSEHGNKTNINITMDDDKRITAEFKEIRDDDGENDETPGFTLFTLILGISLALIYLTKSKGLEVDTDGGPMR
ncbi:MAG: InlB B-repeat-containing protein [Thermoplasmatota archaeon]